jgi:uncharacterized protein YdaU (DUF1376 family)
MNFYQFHVGDYASHTNHLSVDEDLTYRRLLDLYYDLEGPIPTDIPRVSRRIRMGTETTKLILQEFFKLAPEGYRNHRADAEIAKYHAFRVKQKSNGIKGGRPKKTQGLDLGKPDVTQNNPNQLPITNNQVKEKVQKEKVTRPVDVQPDTWDAFLAARRLSKAIVTDRVLRTIRAEADKAGWSLDSALAEVAARGWRGFKAEWVGSGTRQKTAQERDAAVLGALTRGIVGGADAKFLK